MAAGDLITCFWIEPTSRVELNLRRYRHHEAADDCPQPGYGYHNAVVVIGEDDRANHLTAEGYTSCNLRVPQDDPRWPKACACGYEFVPHDPWQVNANPIYEGTTPTGVWTGRLNDAPVGAMYDCWWFRKHYLGPDGIHLLVKTPGGEWLVDAPSRDLDTGEPTGGWTRTGKPPLVTARPSIMIRSSDGDRYYHGYLTDGVLEDLG